MRKELISLKDFEVTSNENVIERGQKFQSCIDQTAQFGCKSYWVMARTGVGAKMQIDGYDGEVRHIYPMIIQACRKGLRPRRLA